MYYELSYLVDLTLKEYYMEDKIHDCIEELSYEDLDQMGIHMEELRLLLLIKIIDEEDITIVKEIFEKISERASQEYFNEAKGSRYDFITNLMEEYNLGI